MRKNPDIHAQWAAVIGALCLLFIGVLPVSAQEAALGDSVSADTLAIPSADSLNADPEWYVVPEIPVSLRAPKRAPAAAASCTRVEAIQTFNIDSVLTEGTYYEYDAKGNVISTTVWTYNPDGTMTGKSKNEYAFDAAGTQTMTAVYIWDGAANDWKGTEKYEYVYKTFAGEKKMISNTSLVWLNGAWVADQRFTYDYDASLREISYFEYRRNTSTNELQPVKGREQSWTNDLQTLEALYTAYANGKWTAGTKKEWAFDGNGTQTMCATYTISNGAWVGSSKETWAYNTSSKLTLHEKYGWAGNDWLITLQENTTYDASGNTTLIENYSWSNGIKTGTKKEQYSFDGGKPVLTMVYAWSNGAWIGSSKEVWNYNASSKLTLHEKYGWANNDWSLTLQEKTVYSGANITLIENYTWSNGVKTGTKKEEYTYSGSLKTSFVTYSWAGSDWVGASKEIWAYTSGKQTLHETYAWGITDWSITLQENTAYSGANITLIENYTWTNGTKTGTRKEIWAYTSGKQTLHETYAWGITDWSITLQENTAYSGANITKIENYTWTNGTKTGTQKEEYAYTGSQKTQEIIYAWANDAWVETTKEVWGYTSGKLTHHETYTWNGDWSKTLEENTTYDGANITKIENYTYANGVKTGTQKEEYTYTSGEKTMTVVYAWANNDWVYSTKNEAGYRDGNVEVSATNYAWNGSAWVGTGTRTQTTYDGSKIIEKLTKNWPSDATDWTNAAITTNTYNADGANIMTYNGTWNGSRWVMSSMTRTDIIKDDQGRQLLRASWKCGADSVWKGVAKDTAAYTESGKTLYIAQYASWLNKNWVPVYKVEYQYDQMERMTLNQRYDWKNNKWQGKYKYEYEYDDQGRQTMSASYKSWNTSKNDWVGSTKSEIVYDANGRKDTETSYKWSGNRWVYLFNNIYQYDASGREILHIVQYQSDGEWVNSEKYEKEYYGGIVVKNNVSVWNSNGWQIFTKEESYYDNGAQSKLRNEIKGSWDINGVLQSYSDNRYSYNCDPHFYTVRFVNYDGKVLENTTVKEGETPVYPGSTPTKPADTENTYTFSGWTPALAPATSNITYTATFTAVKKAYTITWKNEDGSIISQETLAYGAMPMHADITKESTAEYTYTFAGWTPGIGIVTSDAEYTATFTQTKNSYLITFQNEDGTVLSSDNYEYGTMPTIPTAPTKPADGANTYTFAGWDKEIAPVTEATTYTATYNATKNSYTVTWLNSDNSPLAQTIVAYGESPVYTGEMPSRPNTAQYTYTFVGWSPEVETVTADATYTATFDSIVNSYTINWLNSDNSPLAQTTVAYGETPVYTGEKPSRPTTAEYTYTFAGWSPEVTTVTGEATYTATYDSVVNEYTISWFNDDNTLIDQTTVAYGVVPTHADASKENTAEFTYTFSGWDHELVAVVGTASYTATYTATKNSYTVTWLNEDGSEIESETLEYGATPAHVEIYKESTAEYTYTFAGWTPGIGIVTGDAEYTATFTQTKNKYLVTFVDEDGTVLQSSEVEYGAMPTAPLDPTKANTAEWSYTFNGWTPQVETVTGDAEYTATYTATKNSYTVTWLNEDGSEIECETLEYGATPAHVDIYKESTAEYTYTFAGWTPQVEAVTGNAEYTATFTATKNSYTITFKNEDGYILKSSEIEYGAMPVAPESPIKTNTAEYTYTFSGWTPQVETVTGDAEYKATFTATKNIYTITWKNEEGSVIESQTLEYGATPAHADIYKENTAEYTYTFAGWTPTIAEVTGDATYTASFTATKNKYLVTFKDEDGTTLKSEELEYGVTPVAPEDPTKGNTAEYSYTFSRWDKEVVSVTEAATYTATYNATKNSYTITFADEDGMVLQSSEVEYGAMPTAPSNPTKANTAEWSYTFAGWTPQVETVTGDAEYKATFTASKNIYTITWKNEEGSVIESQTLEYGATPTHADITKESTAEYTYTFAGWTPAVATVTGDAEYKATFTATKNTYTITWLNEDGSQISQIVTNYGEMPTAPADPTKAATAEYTYTFAGWTPAVATVTGDATYTATFTATERVENKTFTITFYYEDGVTVLDQVTVKYGETPSTSLIPSKYSEEHYYYSFAGWSPEIVPATGDASYTATYRAIPQQYTVTFKNYNGRILLTTNAPYGEIPVYAGETPAKPKDKQYTYTFSGWSPELTEVTGPATYTAVFEGILNQYTVLFLDEDGTELDRQAVDYGAMPVYAGETPQKEEDEQYRYTFKDWSPKLAKVTKDATYRATYTRRSKTEGLGDVQRDDVRCTKVLIDGQIYILRGDKTYTLQGVEVR